MPTIETLRLPITVVVLTLALVFLTYQIVRVARKRQVREDFDRTREEVESLTLETLRAERQAAEDLVRARSGRLNRDAAALLMALRLEAETARNEGRPPSREAIERIRANLARIRAGEPAEFPRGECFLRAYHSAVDGSFQPYGINVPKGYDGSRPFPLILFLHGLSGFRLFQCLRAPAFEGAITVSPQGRGATDYMAMGEDDILAVIDEVGLLYNVDPSRVYLTGRSMGGTGAWHLAVHYPDRFAGIVPFAGNADHRAWEARWGWNAAPPESHADLRAFLHARLSPVFYTENMRTVPVVAVHGTGDNVVPVEHARGMVDRLRALDHPAMEYFEFPQSGHGGFPAWTQEYGLAKVVAHGPARVPNRIDYRLTDLRHNTAWWLRVDLRDHPARFSDVQAQAEGDTVNIATDNITGLTLLLDRMAQRPGRVRIDGALLAVPETGDTFSLERWQGAWRPAQDHPVLKRRGASGPISDLLRDPFVLVYGTQGVNELHKDVSRTEAERVAREWTMRYGAEPRLKADTEVDELDMRIMNVVCFGGPRVNAVTERLADTLPLRLEGEVVRMGERIIRGQDIGFMTCYPNPNDPKLMVAVVAGRTPGALFQAFDRFGLWFNWGIYDKYRWFDYAVFDARSAGPESLLAVGFYDNRWRLPAETACPLGGGAQWERNTALTDALAPQGTPTLLSAAESSDESVSLSDVWPTHIEQYRGAVGFDRTYAGRPITIDGTRFEKGLGVKAPSSVTFKLNRAFETFTATVALTPGHKSVVSPARQQAESVVFQVKDGDTVLAETEPLSYREDGAQHATIIADVDGVIEITLTTVPQGGRTWLYGGAVWADPTVTR